MLIKDLLPSVESFDRYLEDVTDFLNGLEVEGMHGKNSEDEAQTVAAVGNDRIREYRMRMTTPGTDQAGDRQAYVFTLAINKIRQKTVIAGISAETSPASTTRTNLQSRVQFIHAFLKNRLPGSFFLKKLAIDQILSYHNYCIRHHAFIRTGL